MNDTPKIQYKKAVEVRVRSYGEKRCTNQQKSKTKNEGHEQVESDLLHDLPGLAAGFQRKIGRRK